MLNRNCGVYFETLRQVLSRETTQLGMLAVVAGLAFFSHLDVPIREGLEGFYADITREMVRSQAYLHLSYVGEPYTNKPPLFFWIQAAFIRFAGESETTIRLPGAIFNLATVATTYLLGKILFSRIVAFWAALVIPTTYVFLWYGRQGLFEAPLTFFMTLALLAFLLAYTETTRKHWYLISFLAMAFGSMIKALHGFGLPFLVIVVFLIIARDTSPLRDRYFRTGIAVFLLMLAGYYWVLGETFRQQHLFDETTGHVFSMDRIELYMKKRPIYWYMTLIWFDFFPWIALLVPSIATTNLRSLLHSNVKKLFLVLWVLVYFLALSLAQAKRERYLLIMVPGIALLIGTYCWSLFCQIEQRGWVVLMTKVLAISAVLACTLAPLIGPALLSQRWVGTHLDLPVEFMALTLICAIWFFYTSLWGNLRMALPAFGIVAVLFSVGIIHYVEPVVASSPGFAKAVSDSIKATLAGRETRLVVFRPSREGFSDVLYYLDLGTGIPQPRTVTNLKEIVRNEGEVLILTALGDAAGLIKSPDFNMATIKEFGYGRKSQQHLVLLSARAQRGSL